MKIWILVSVLSLFTACGGVNSTSQTSVTDVEHSLVKRQSIGNCWLYAVSSWAESLHKSHTGEEMNFSESYWTYWHWYNKLRTGQAFDEMPTGGSWYTARSIVSQHGYMLEGDFIADEADDILSERQRSAEEYLNLQLVDGGALADPSLRTRELILDQLDIAFGVDRRDYQVRVQNANNLIIDETRVGIRVIPISLNQAMNSSRYAWNYASYPRIYGETATASASIQNQRANVLRRVMRALNDEKPVIMSVMIDFNAWDQTTSHFNMATLDENGVNGRQGGHMLALEDYTVVNVPGVGEIGEGMVSEDLQQQALSGDLNYFVTKNSWGPSVGDGYHRFDLDYLNGQIGWSQGDEDEENRMFYTTLSAFVLPPGY